MLSIKSLHSFFAVSKTFASGQATSQYVPNATKFDDWNNWIIFFPYTLTEIRLIRTIPSPFVNIFFFDFTIRIRAS